MQNEHTVLLEVELHGQGNHRREGARAGLSRTEWEIVSQETALAIRTLRAFDNVIYRQEKMQLVQETVQLNEQAVTHLPELVAAKRIGRADLLVAQTEVVDAKAQIGPARAAYLAATQELRRAMGATEGTFQVRGSLDAPGNPWDADALTSTALERRADLHARKEAIAEADARLRLAIADRHGNPTVGPTYEFNESRVHFIGGVVNVPLPLLNKRQGEIQQRDAERARAALEMRQTEVLIRLDVQAALARLQDARQWVDMYQGELLPNLRKSLKLMEDYLVGNEPNVDVLKIIDVRRKLLKARDGYLDAHAELRQAQADLAAAAGEPALALTPSERK